MSQPSADLFDHIQYLSWMKVCHFALLEAVIDKYWPDKATKEEQHYKIPQRLTNLYCSL